jgi:RND family efflux transporter MFP subunit
MKPTHMRCVSIALTAMLLSACGGDSSTGGAVRDTGRAVLITTGRASVEDLPVWLQSVGRVHSVAAPTLAAEVDGRVTLVAVDTGDRIEAGQLLAATDTSTLVLRQEAARAAVERLEVHIANGQRRVERFEKLSARDLSSQTQLDDAKEQLEAYRADSKAAEAQLALVGDSLAKSRIVAPVAGIVQRRLISEGDFVNRGQPLFEITRPERLQAWLPFPEAVALQVRIGQPVELFSPLTPGQTVGGEVTDLQPTLGDGSRAVMAIVDLQNPGLLRPGATLTGRVLVETRKAAVMVPNMSIVQRPAGDTVYVINGTRAEARLVTRGNERGTQVEILSGLSGNEVIAADGAAFLTDGATVSIRESQS